MKHSFKNFMFAVIAAFFSVPVMGVSYPVINATTKANLTDQTADIQEELWCRKVILGAQAMYDTYPLADGFMGEGDGGKAIISITDTEKVDGTTIHIPTYGGFGGPGSQGSADRIGNEQKIQVGSFDVKIGRYWFGVGYNAVARDETMINGKLDGMIIDGLRALHAQKRNDDMIRLMLAHADANSRNLSFTSGGPSTVATIKTAHYVDTATISSVRNKLSSLGSLPMSLGKQDSGGSRLEKYMFFSTQHGLGHLDFESAYLQAQQNANARGNDNPVFAGNYTDWSGVGIYRWYQKDHGNRGPIGSLLAPRGYLATGLNDGANGGGDVTFAGTAVGANAITSADWATTAVGADANNAAASFSLTLGGSVAAAAVTPTPEYTRYFSNAPWTYHWGDTIAADTSTARYVMLIHPTTGAWGVFKYTNNNGKVIKLTHNVKFGTSGETTDWLFPTGSLVVECNVLGVPVGRSIAFGREALINGVGTINGSKSSPKFGRRTEEHRNHDLDHAIGAEVVWGAALIKRADTVAPGFVVVNSAIPVDGAPVVS